MTEEGADRWSVYLPRGTWVDPWTKETLEGPDVVERPAPLDRIPVYAAAARAAELVPLFDGLDATASGEAEPELLEVR